MAESGNSASSPPENGKVFRQHRKHWQERDPGGNDMMRESKQKQAFNCNTHHDTAGNNSCGKLQQASGNTGPSR